LFTSFLNDIKNTIDRHAPLHKLSKKKTKLTSKPWLTKGIFCSKTFLLFCSKTYKDCTKFILLKNKQRLHKTFYRNGNNFEK